MRNPSTAAVAALLGASVSIFSQQPNTPLATLSVNGLAGPPFPITVPVASPGPLTVDMTGAPFSPFALFYSPLPPTPFGFPTAFGIYDLDIPSSILLPAGALLATDTGPTGTATALALALPPGLGGSLGALQGVVATPPGPLLLTAAAGLVVPPPPPTPLSLSDNGSVAAALPFSFPFYGAVYSALYVNANGSLTFGAPTSTPTGSPGAFLAGPPTIAPFWWDLDPSSAIGGAAPSVTVQGDPTIFRVAWTDINAAFTAQRHTFAVVLFPDGTIAFDYGAGVRRSNRALVGLSPGGGLAANPPANLSLAAPFVGAPFAAVYENFVGRVAGGVAGRFDLGGGVATFVPTGIGGYAVALSAAAPRIDWVHPLAGPGVGALRGAGFAPGTTVELSANGGPFLPAPFVAPVSSEELTISTPPTFGETWFDMRVTAPGSPPVVRSRAIWAPPSGGALTYAPGTAGAFTAGVSIPFMGGSYATLHLDRRGYISCAAPYSSAGYWSTSSFAAMGPAILGLWADLEPGLGSPAAGGDAMLVVQVSYQTGHPSPFIHAFFRAAPEANDYGSNDFSILVRGTGEIETNFGPCDALGSRVGIKGVGTGTSADLSANLGAFVSAPGDAIQQLFALGGAPFDLAGVRIRYVPANSAATIYALQP